MQIGSNIMLIGILGSIIIVSGIFAFRLVKDAIDHKEEVKKEPGNNILMAIFSFFLFLLSTLGISDFALSMAVYPKAKWVETKNMPGTMNVQCAIPCAVMALAYINAIKIDVWTLTVPIVCQMLGSYLSPRYVVKLPVNTIRKAMAIALFLSAGFILAGKFGLMPAQDIGGTQLTGIRLALLGLGTFILGALNNIGVGSYSLCMILVYSLGLSPAAAFPIMMGAGGLSVPVGSMQFIKEHRYNRKIALFCSTFGVLGVLLAVFFIKSLDVSVLLWFMVGIILYTAITMVRTAMKEQGTKESSVVTENVD
jgi:uncharacterized membrane protein YfcA